MVQLSGAASLKIYSSVRYSYALAWEQFFFYNAGYLLVMNIFVPQNYFSLYFIMSSISWNRSQYYFVDQPCQLSIHTTRLLSAQWDILTSGVAATFIAFICLLFTIDKFVILIAPLLFYYCFFCFLFTFLWSVLRTSHPGSLDSRPTWATWILAWPVPPLHWTEQIQVVKIVALYLGSTHCLQFY